ncbi:RNA polymerase sigma-70 factor [Sunxiuqinia indica]|uniref:RNA polymerase sigma-70 factor n=1 Tax=Sunxiuqinia indica TaxID=2692584 RepID=UPI0013585FD1|nr:RNA polymerase sigma-70 factor [Sunxiuqinia indica]
MGKIFNHEKVIAELARDSQLALEELFNHYYPRLFHFSKAYLKFDDGIDDILQEVFLKIWRNRKNIKNSSTFNSYIFTITQNLLLNELRSRLNNQKMKDQLFKVSVAEEFLFAEKVEYDDLKNKIEEFIQELPSRQKEIFKLSRMEGLSNKEIAEKLRISTKTVEYHIGQSISILKKRLKSSGLISLLYIHLFL